MKEVRLRKIDDMHVHLRQADMLRSVLPHTALQCERALIMPNTTPPILTADDLVSYKRSIVDALGTIEGFTPLMTFKIVPSTTSDEIRLLKDKGATAGKLYPDGVTTNSEGGVVDFKSLYPVYETMQEVGLVLCLHGEMPGVFSMDRESAFLMTLREISRDFPNLKLVLEHATTRDAVLCVLELPANVAASLTVHHLYLTLDDIIGDRLNPHAFCKPIAKRPEDRDALIEAALSGNPKFFLGSDSAPHPIPSKECSCGAAGVYSAPVLLPALYELFERHNRLERLEPFTSEFAAKFYGLPLNQSTVTLQEDYWTVPDQYDEVRPFLAGTKLRWKVAQRETKTEHLERASQASRS
jgi:dihydroorotase